MEHRDSKDRPKLVRKTTYPLTGADCVDVVVTDLAILRRRTASGCSKKWPRASRPTRFRQLTDMDIKVAVAR